MDRKSAQIPEIRRLIDISAAARNCLSDEIGALRQRLDVPARIRGSLKEHPAAWLFGSIGSGLAASFAFRRHPAQAPKPRGGRSKLLGFAWNAARPLVKIWLADQVKSWIAGHAAGSPASQFLTRFTPTSKSR